MKPVTLESPYAGDVPENVAYASLGTLALLGIGFAPYASHLHLTNVLDDAVPQHRDLGIEAGLTLASMTPAVVFLVDLGWSRGMRAALDRHRSEGRPCYTARLGHAFNGRSWTTTFDDWATASKTDPNLTTQLGLAMDLEPLPSKTP